MHKYGLKTLHVNGLIHGDFNPTNVLINEDGIYKIGKKIVFYIFIIMV
jgi:serine/threonine protein kinase